MREAAARETSALSVWIDQGTAAAVREPSIAASGCGGRADDMKPCAQELVAARERVLPDVIAPGLRLLFVGINPGLYSAAIGHHFGRPGNRFWPALWRAGLTPRLYDPREDRALLELGLGITNLVARTTARAAELEPEEVVAGARTLAAKVEHFAPEVVAILGITSYRVAFGQPKAKLGWHGMLGPSRLHVLPNPSGLNAHHQLDALARLFRAVLA
ncbi:MAG TPA: G/U mismatch-specific DNA glycosylase [Polyangiales bacterium]|nr:G/U mismatch-specific DNA glycosylase [Polyangiales bacterium]